MLKRTITYEDYDGNSRTENFYFNLTTSELAEMHASVNGGLEKYLDTILEAQDVPKIMDTFKEIIQKSYGVKSLDGRKFTKSEADYEDFLATPAYDKLFMELYSDPNKAAEFIIGVLPKDLQDKANAEYQKLLASPDKKE